MNRLGIHNSTGDKIDEIRITSAESVLIGCACASDDACEAWDQIFHRIYEAGIAKGRTYDPRSEAPRDPMGLVGPSDAETIGVPWCPWCRERSHFGSCPDDRNDDLAKQIRAAKPEDS